MKVNVHRYQSVVSAGMLVGCLPHEVFYTLKINFRVALSKNLC